MAGIIGFAGIRWTVSPIVNLGFNGIRWNPQSYLIIKVTNATNAEGVLVNVAGRSLLTNVDGIAIVGDRDFESALITISKGGLTNTGNYDSSIQTNQYIEIDLAESPCVNFYPQETSSFLRLHLASGLVLDDNQVKTNPENGSVVFSGFCEGCVAEENFYFINNYLRNNREYKPKIRINETFNYIVNFVIDSIRISVDHSMSIIDEQGNVIGSNLDFDLIAVDGGFSMRVNTNIPPLSDGVVGRFVWSDPANEITLMSNYFQFVNDVEDLVFLQYRNSNDLYGFDYNIWSDAYNEIYLDLNQVEVQGEFEIKQYQEQSTGKVRTQKSISKKFVAFESYFFDEFGHDAMIALGVHDDIIIDAKQMEIKELYSIEPNIRNNVQRGRIELFDQRFSTINLNG